MKVCARKRNNFVY